MYVSVLWQRTIVLSLHSLPGSCRMLSSVLISRTAVVKWLKQYGKKQLKTTFTAVHAGQCNSTKNNKCQGGVRCTDDKGGFIRTLTLRIQDTNGAVRIISVWHDCDKVSKAKQDLIISRKKGRMDPGDYINKLFWSRIASTFKLPCKLWIYYPKCIGSCLQNHLFGIIIPWPRIGPVHEDNKIDKKTSITPFGAKTWDSK